MEVNTPDAGEERRRINTFGVSLLWIARADAAKRGAIVFRIRCAHARSRSMCVTEPGDHIGGTAITSRSYPWLPISPCLTGAKHRQTWRWQAAPR